MLSESNEELYSAVAHGMLDGVIDDSPMALHYSRAIPGLKYAYRFEGTEGEYAVMIRRGNTSLRDEINVTLAQNGVRRYASFSKENLVRQREPFHCVTRTPE